MPCSKGTLLNVWGDCLKSLVNSSLNEVSGNVPFQRWSLQKSKAETSLFAQSTTMITLPNMYDGFSILQHDGWWNNANRRDTINTYRKWVWECSSMILYSDGYMSYLANKFVEIEATSTVSCKRCAYHLKQFIMICMFQNRLK